jgi:small subunit ribosomal protein S20
VLAFPKIEAPVANHPSAEKRNRQRVKRTLRNRAIKSAVRTQVKTVRAAIAAKDAKAAVLALAEATVALDKAASKGGVERKMASRTVSRLAAQVHKIATA